MFDFKVKLSSKITSNTETTTNFCSEVSGTIRLHTEVKGEARTPRPHLDQVSVNFSSLSTVRLFCISSRTPSKPEKRLLSKVSSYITKFLSNLHSKNSLQLLFTAKPDLLQ